MRFGAEPEPGLDDPCSPWRSADVDHLRHYVVLTNIPGDEYAATVRDEPIPAAKHHRLAGCQLAARRGYRL